MTLEAAAQEILHKHQNLLKPKVKFKRLNENATIPKIAKKGDAGFDLSATEHGIIYHGGQLVLPLGIACEIPLGYVGIIKPRSGIAVKHMLNVHAGVIDSSFRGEIKACLINHGDRPVEFRKGDRIAQLVVVPCLTESIEVNELDNTERGKSGFGSTGF